MEGHYRAVFEPKALVGTKLDRYRLLELIGVGGYGAVYRSEHEILAREVAVKVLRRADGGDAGVRRFMREAQAASAVDSPYVIKAFDSGIAEYPFLVFEYLVGEPLSSWLCREGAGQLADALAFTQEILAGLQAAHAAGVVHRDLKPSNVFLRETVEGASCVLLDFGIAKLGKASLASSNLTRTGMMMGTPSFAAPEQLQSAKHVDARADLYSAGVLLYRMLSGTFPFDDSSYERMLIAIVMHARRPLKEAAPHLPTALCHVVDRAVARDPDARYQNAHAFQAALQQTLVGSGWAGVSQQRVPTAPLIDMSALGQTKKSLVKS
ncbi:MAG: serine/threonine protein kinase [Polyangiales bacterium]